MKKKLRNLIGRLLAIFFISLGLTRRVKKRAKNGEFILSVFFHNPGRELFEYCIKWLLKNKFVFLTQNDVIAYSQQNKPLPKNAVIITVDDGWQGNIENVVKVAAKYKVPVTIFISTEPVQNGVYWWSYIEAGNKNVEFYKTLPNDQRLTEVKDIKDTIVLNREAMTSDQVKEIAEYDCITIGGHTVNHPILTKCNDEDVYNELNTSKIVLEEWINKPVDSFAYPNGSYGKREVEYLKQLNYSIAYTTKAAYLNESSLQNILELPRFFVLENISNAEALCRMLGVWQAFFD
ncbi:polysaccharide deacetylase family protein [Mucilaginibacter sp.]|uniref:polysaccharide deacetylase family protein n=1 Tax=Mucilaginibacter sp. TaxID=1882438 RepID=UPI002627B844|nr:polysaccharide deacetylase family protein [Mucilaginibacter sp.]MDB4927119.1 polysaccharide deacetylase family protein [Mucilaginibacter sp.]